MARRTIDPNDPREVAVQVSFRLPWWYREQLAQEAAKYKVSVPELVLAAVEHAYDPKPPT
jgi:hypothetical protein